MKQQKPAPLPYPKQKIKWNHLGIGFEKLYLKAIEETDEEKKQGYIQVLGGISIKDQIVQNAQYLMDSESFIKSK